jgi:hypothetical protein
LATDDILGYLMLMASSDPSNYLQTRTALDGTFDFCKNSQKVFWPTTPECEEGFVADDASGFCYKILSGKLELYEGEDQCQTKYDAELLYFDRNAQVRSFIEAAKSGKKF